ncbi:hypothetical protein DEU56DRAFT_493494 [Suillus clintonianus]|uniref:uncharacterized protein n=1 Tax=Suillus clintonianus TaxID=1904413 RepID=UPI001B85E14F|nr:uncharacterized protein DEU56DRAFT_493494 [Suillus clintonianus]KAG2129609.1 hypothetical protein DEU56DRAFT_493494 [Suillus clintonianus]
MSSSFAGTALAMLALSRTTSRTLAVVSRTPPPFMVSHMVSPSPKPTCPIPRSWPVHRRVHYFLLTNFRPWWGGCLHQVLHRAPDPARYLCEDDRRVTSSACPSLWTRWR